MPLKIAITNITLILKKKTQENQKICTIHSESFFLMLPLLKGENRYHGYQATLVGVP